VQESVKVFFVAMVVTMPSPSDCDARTCWDKVFDFRRELLGYCTLLDVESCQMYHPVAILSLSMLYSSHCRSPVCRLLVMLPFTVASLLADADGLALIRISYNKGCCRWCCLLCWGC
jgi:hypothetical protein